MTVTRDGMVFDYVAKEGKHRAISVTDEVVLPTVRALADSDNGLGPLFSYQHGDSWRILHSRDVSNYIVSHGCSGHFTAKEFAHLEIATVLMALALANAETSARGAEPWRRSSWPAFARWRAGLATPRPRGPARSYIDPQADKPL